MTEAAEGPFLLPSVQRRNLLFVVIDGIVVGIMSAGASFVSVWVIRLGASPFWVSMLSSLPSTIALVMTIPWSTFAGRQRRPERLLAFARLSVHAVYPLIAAVPFFLQGEWAAITIVLVWSLSAFPSSLSNMMFTLVMGHAVTPDRRSFLMSRRWTFLGIAKLIVLPIASQLIEQLPFPQGYQLVYGINGLLALGAFYCATQIRVEEHEPLPPAKREPLLDRLRSSMTEIRQARSFLVFVSGRALLNLGLTLVAAVVPIFWVDHLQSSDTWIGYFNAALSGATLVAYFPWVRYKRKHGTRRTLIPAAAGLALYPALLALVRVPVAVLPVVAFYGLAGAGINLAFFDTLLETVPHDREARYVAINNTIVHLSGVIGPPIGAAMLSAMPIRLALALGTVVSLLGVAIFGFARRPQDRPEDKNSTRSEE